MDFTLFLNSQAPTDQSAEELFEGLVTQTRAARDSGFDMVTMGQHYLADYVQLQLVPALSRLAAEAGSMSVATGIVLLPLHHPVEIAEQITTIGSFADEVVAGVGAGYRDAEFDAFGVDKRERGPRLAEGIELMNRLWTEKGVSYDGEFYSVEDATITPRPDEKPEVWVAANSRPAIERAAKLGDRWFVNPHATVAEITEQKTLYDEHKEGDTSVPVFREVFVAETTEEAREIARPYLEPKYERYVEWGQDEAMEDAEDLHRPFDDLAEDRFLLGTPEEVCEEIETYQETLDPSHMVCRVQWPGLSYERARECIELIGDEVVPQVGG
jgi:alkanesulfonate monooxygenase SsuD/methylene tetrahydromethanopterin reductase-like flavin-dependent oxidoreductase (luciferase family)